MVRDCDMDDAAALMRENHQDEQETKRRGRHVIACELRRDVAPKREGGSGEDGPPIPDLSNQRLRLISHR